jgi:hypothetical protein
MVGAPALVGEEVAEEADAVFHVAVGASRAAHVRRRVEVHAQAKAPLTLGADSGENVVLGSKVMSLSAHSGK